MLHGALAAAVTPLTDRGEEVDEAAFEPYVDFLVAGGLDGILALGTTGEGFLLSLSGRVRAADLCMQAAELGADAVAVIAPPYFALDAAELAVHFIASARACAPVPFYIYEFERVSGYAVPPEVLELVCENVPNLAGLKVSDAPF